MSSEGELFITEVVEDLIPEEIRRKIEEKVKEVGGDSWELEIPDEFYQIWNRVNIPRKGKTHIIVSREIKRGIVEDIGIIGVVRWVIPKIQYYEVCQDYYAGFDPNIKVKIYKKLRKVK
ncbi:MAG: hypothetical protein ACTSVB_05530, partial [Candidatus Heimdallarchaeaceae archaeon]